MEEEVAVPTVCPVCGGPKVEHEACLRCARGLETFSEENNIEKASPPTAG
jgi:ribosomal protein L32